ncbi:MAG TPA: glycerol-3-phosphate dehydrogenase/oxidase [Solirubrobacteraceae bacterium]|jgi:glycerol-3-phosphate dehydrogenase|nr:glycerol-3-phosphate dehydrogenase/oxidase [Solirubrobacteraceae bacterium]
MVIARQDALRTLAAEEFDLLVIGGGITGAGVALDAASRGYSVALIERADYASGTSSRSSKLVHGGLRYLQNFDLALVREALLERQLLTALAPHLVRPLPLVVPAFDGTRPDRLMGVGLNLYDVMSVTDRRSVGERLRAGRARRGRGERGSGGERTVGEEEPEPSRVALLERSEAWSPERHRILSAEEVRELLPALAAREPSSGYLFYDCQTDDARLVLTVLGEAERFGAVCANRLCATELMVSEARVRGAHVRDEIGGERFELRATNVVNATGVWADALLSAPGAPGEAGAGGEAAGTTAGEAQLPHIRPSRGTHLTLRHEDVPLVAGAIVPAGGGRSIFALPWLGRTLVGTTDNDYEGPLEHVSPSEQDVDYLLDAVNEFFALQLDRSHLTGAFAGVRPLISTGDSKKSVDISRRAELYESPDGTVTITGGKLTTWRRMAKQTVDRLVAREAREAPCRTAEIPLGQPVDADELERVAGVEPAALAALAARYGYAAHEVLAIAAERPELSAPIQPGLPDLQAEVVLAARREQAASVGDVLLRRTRLALLAARELWQDGGSAGSVTAEPAEPAEPGPAAVVRVAELLGEELGWDERRREAEVERFRREARDEGVVVGA